MAEVLAEVNDTQLGSTGAGWEWEGGGGEIGKKRFEGCLEVIAISQKRIQLFGQNHSCRNV